MSSAHVRAALTRGDNIAGALETGEVTEFTGRQKHMITNRKNVGDLYIVLIYLGYSTSISLLLCTCL